MGNESTSQQQLVNDEDPSDVMDMIRDIGGGVKENFSIPRTAVGYQMRLETSFLSSAEILALFTTPQVIVNGVPDKIIIPRRVILSMSGATVNYATNVVAIVGSETSIDSTHYTMAGTLPLVAFPVMTLLDVFTDTSAITAVVAGDNLAISVRTGNPTAGDGNITVKVYYELIDA